MRSPLASLFLVGLVLRPQIVGIGPLLPRIEPSLGISHAVAGLLATIPVVCMGIFAPLAPPLLRRHGSRLAVGGALVLLGAVGVLRALVPGAGLVLLFTVPVGVGIAVSGTLLPVVVREEYPERPTLGTGVYTTGINVGATVATVAAVPIALLAGWRGTLVVYSVVTVLATLPWLRRRHAAAEPPERATLPWRAPVAWVLAGAFAFQSIMFYGFNAWLPDVYVDRGWHEAAAGALVAVVNGVALLFGILTALTADRFATRRGFLVGGALAGLAGSCLVAADVPGAWAWAVVLGVAIGILFTTVMTLPLDAADDRAEVAALSTLMLGVGYVVAGLAPIGLGAVRDATGSFELPLALLAADALLFLIVVSAGSRRVSSLPAATPRTDHGTSGCVH